MYWLTASLYTMLNNKVVRELLNNMSNIDCVIDRDSILSTKNNAEVSISLSFMDMIKFMLEINVIDLKGDELTKQH